MALQSKIVLDAIRKNLEYEGIQFYIEHRGDKEAGAIYIKHDRGESEIDVYHRVNEFDKGMQIKFLDSFNDNALNAFFKKQLEVDSDLWLVEIVSRKINLKAFLLELGL